MNVHVSNVRARPAAAASRVAPARAYLDAHVAERVSLDALAALAGVSKFHFVRLFHRVVGESPHAYQLRGRVAMAKALLSSGHSASRVAQETGFADHSHLIRTFRRLTGMTPTRFAVDSAIAAQAIADVETSTVSTGGVPTDAELVPTYAPSTSSDRWVREAKTAARSRAWNAAGGAARERVTSVREEPVAG